MLPFLLLTFIAGLPILAYVLAQNTNNKGMVIGSSIIIFSICLIIFISKFAILGSLQKQILTNKIFDEIYIDSKISKEYLNRIKKILSEDEQKTWLISLISESIELKKLNSAESLIAFSEIFFVSNNEKLIFYRLYTNLRDEKFPKYKDSNFIIESDSKYPCLVDAGNISIFINNGPRIPLAKKEFSSMKDLVLNNQNSIIPGFDIASAQLNQETIELNIKIFCNENDSSFYLKNLIVLPKDRTSIKYKIDLNEWLKVPQEL